MHMRIDAFFMRLLPSHSQSWYGKEAQFYHRHGPKEVCKARQRHLAKKRVKFCSAYYDCAKRMILKNGQTTDLSFLVHSSCIWMKNSGGTTPDYWFPILPAAKERRCIPPGWHLLACYLGKFQSTKSGDPARKSSKERHSLCLLVHLVPAARALRYGK